LARVHPTYEEVCAHLEEARSRSGFVRRQRIGKSFEGRDLWLAVVTDFDVPDEDKQVVALTCGVHGSEESGRALGMAVLDWAQTDAADETRRRQKILVFSCVNPDGAVRDSYHNAQDINICRAYQRDGKCTTPEAQAVWDVLMREVPDAFVDCHGLAGGGMHELVLPMLGRLQGSENVIAQTIARDMAQAAEDAGFPQHTPHLVDAWVDGLDFIEKMLFDRFHTIAFTLEMNECYLDWRECQKSGLARLRALFDYGNRASFALPYEGYPNGWLLGGAMCGLVPHGRTAAERRKSRAQLVPWLPQVPKLSRRPDSGGNCRVILETARGEVPAPAGLSIAVRVYPWCRIREVTFDGRALKRDVFPTGYRIHDDGCSHQCVADVGFPLHPGEHELVVRYDEERS